MTYYQNIPEHYSQALSLAQQYIDLQEYIENFIDSKLLTDEGLDSFTLSHAGDDVEIEYYTTKYGCSCCPSEHGEGSVRLSTILIQIGMQNKKKKSKKAQTAEKRAKTVAKKKRQRDQLQSAQATIARITNELNQENT